MKRRILYRACYLLHVLLPIAKQDTGWYDLLRMMTGDNYDVDEDEGINIQFSKK